MKTQKFWKDIFSQIISEADVIFEILDARNPLGTRNYMLEDFVKKNAPNKKIYLILNKVDLIPLSILKKWVTYLEETIDTRVFAISALYKRGIIYFKKKLGTLLPRRQYKAIIVGYPNTGKSSLISALAKEKGKKIGVSSRAGYTRGIMEIKISSNISLIDTPGVIPLSEDNEIDQALKSVINPEKIRDPESVAFKIIDVYVSVHKILEHYGIDETYIKENLEPNEAANFCSKFIDNLSSTEINQSKKIVIQSSDIFGNNLQNNSNSLSQGDFDFIIKLIGKKRGILIRGGEINEKQVYKLIIREWQKNKIKFYTIPPSASE